MISSTRFKHFVFLAFVGCLVLVPNYAEAQDNSTATDSPAATTTVPPSATTTQHVTTTQDLPATQDNQGPLTDDMRKQFFLEAVNSHCIFDPEVNISMIKIVSDDDKLIMKGVGSEIEAECADGLLRKQSEEDHFVVTCGLYLRPNSYGLEVLKFYWNFTDVKDSCGNAPVCTLMDSTYNHPILVSSTDQLQSEEELNFALSEGDSTTTKLGFYPVGTHQTYNVTEGACGNDSLTVTGSSTWSICEAPDDLALLSNDDDPEEMRTLFWYYNYGLWTQQPPECEIKKCTATDRATLGFSPNDVFNPDLESYLLGETVEVSCVEGEYQLNTNVTTETITCVLNDAKEAVFKRESHANLQLDTCSVKQCSSIPLRLLGFGDFEEFAEEGGPYNLWDTRVVQCKEGSLQNESTVENETVTCLPIIGGSDFAFQRSSNTSQRITQCEPIMCPVPQHLSFSVPNLNPLAAADSLKPLNTQAVVSCPDIGFDYFTQCVRQDTPSTVGRWVPTPTCRSKTCRHFMSDPILFEYELQYRRNIIGEPRAIEFNDNLTFVCPRATVAYMRNELTYQCRLGPNGLGQFEPWEWDVKPDCRAIKCPRNDTHTGSYFDIVYPHYERKCEEQGECKEGMIMSLDCTATEPGFKPLYQCILPDNPPVLSMGEEELKADTLSGVWYPAPTCDRGCSPPVNISGVMDCEVGWKFGRGNWTFKNDSAVECVCKKGYTRDDPTPPEAECNGQTWVVTRTCHVDCNPLPIMPHAIQNLTYYDDHALMNVTCEPGYEFFPLRSKAFRPVTGCYLHTYRWLNLHLFQCKKIDGCRKSEINTLYPDVYILPGKSLFNQGEIALAQCNRGHLESTAEYEVLRCETEWKEVVRNVTWSPLAHPDGSIHNISDWKFYPNETMEFVRFKWDYSHLRGNLTCITEDEP